MDIVEPEDKKDEAPETPESTAGIGLDQEGLDQIWQSFYMQNMRTLEDVYRQIGEPLLEEMANQIPGFDPKGKHEELFEEAVRKNIPVGAEPYIMGIINGGLVALVEIGRRMSLDIAPIKRTLDDLNPNSDANANLAKYLEEEDGKQPDNISEPVRKETSGS